MCLFKLDGHPGRYAYRTSVQDSYSIVRPLVLLILSLITHNVIEPKLIVARARAHDAQPISELLLLQVFLRQVLQVSSTELLMGYDLDLAISLLRDADGIAEIASTAFNFDTVVEELLERGDIEDLVAGGLRCVDSVLRISLMLVQRTNVGCDE